jgi:hypothetical protein
MEQIIDLRNVLRYLGVAIKGSTMMFGDNESVVNSSSIPHARLHKRHTALSFHRVREGIAAGIAKFHHVCSADNPADILSQQTLGTQTSLATSSATTVLGRRHHGIGS